MKNKGFTLIELLVVIGIIAVLAVVVVLVLNPAQLFAQARDAQRISDFATLQRAINYTLSTAGTITITAGPYETAAGTCGFTSCTGITTRAVYTTGGSGWVGLDFAQATGGSPLTKLPADPTNSTTYFYAWKSNGSASNPLYEVDARLESTKYQGMMTTDGGDANTCTTYTETTCFYEAGNSLTQ